jgi:hypothetical protein
MVEFKNAHVAEISLVEKLIEEQPCPISGALTLGRWRRRKARRG